MSSNTSNTNLQSASFRNRDLSNSDFSGSDLRGADFSGANLTRADFSNTRTGITPANIVWLFIAALAISLLSGYVAMLTGRTLNAMFISSNPAVRKAGILSSILIVLFILYAYWKGGGNAIRNMIIPVIGVALLIGIIVRVFGIGTGNALWYMILSLVLIVVMFIIGTISRAAAGSLSNILFLVVALSGGMFGRSIGGGIGTVVMAIACMQISKRALKNVEGFEFLRKVAYSVTRKFGTSFEDANLSEAKFIQAKVHNADFTGANLSLVNWTDAKKSNCLEDEIIITDSKKNKNGGRGK